MVDLSRETLIPLADVPKLKQIPVRRNGTRLAMSTLYRWVHRGVKGRRLETVLVGAQRCTSLEALGRFFHVQAEKPPVGQLKEIKNKSQRHIDQELDRLGL